MGPTAAPIKPLIGQSLMEFPLGGEMELIANRVLPVFESGKQSATYGIVTLESLLRARNTLRAPGGGYSRGEWDWTTGTFACEEHGAEDLVDDRQAAMYRDYFDAELVAARRARDVIVRNAEIRAAALIFDPSVWTGAALTTTITEEWDDKTNAIPAADVAAAKKKVWDGCGLWPNAVVMNARVRNSLKLSDDLVNKIKYSGMDDPKPRNITDAMIAAALDVDMIIVSDQPKNTALEGQAAVIAPIWSDEYVMVCRVATRPNDFEEPCIGRTIHWAEDGSEVGGLVEGYREEAKRANVIRVRHDIDEIVIYTQCGHLLSNATT